jgi:hypothetical protein
MITGKNCPGDFFYLLTAKHSELAVSKYWLCSAPENAIKGFSTPCAVLCPEI